MLFTLLLSVEPCCLHYPQCNWGHQQLNRCVRLQAEVCWPFSIHNPGFKFIRLENQTEQTLSYRFRSCIQGLQTAQQTCIESDYTKESICSDIWLKRFLLIRSFAHNTHKTRANLNESNMHQCLSFNLTTVAVWGGKNSIWRWQKRTESHSTLQRRSLLSPCYLSRGKVFLFGLPVCHLHGALLPGAVWIKLWVGCLGVTIVLFVIAVADRFS